MVIRPVSAGYYHWYRRSIAILLANTNTDTNTNYASGIMRQPSHRPCGDGGSKESTGT
jgi:hypothetical protein